MATRGEDPDESEAHHLEEDILSFFGAGRWSPWFTSLTKALDGVDHIHAARRPGEGINSIWSTVNHISFWHDLALRRLRGEPSTDEEAVESGWSLPGRAAPTVEDLGERDMIDLQLSRCKNQARPWNARGPIASDGAAPAPRDGASPAAHRARGTTRTASTLAKGSCGRT